MFEKQTFPLDSFLRNYFRQNKAIGSKDRQYIADATCELTRWRGLYDALAAKPLTWETRLTAWENQPPTFLSDPEIPLHTRLSFPQALFQLLLDSFGEEKTIEICQASNQRAPTTVRVNTLKISRAELLEKWQGIYKVSPTLHSATGITFHQRINFLSLEEFQEGLFEVQDEGSQLVAQAVAALPGEEVLDFCAGSGGKALAIALHMQHRGQLYLHDIRPSILLQAKKRLRRAGIQNAQILVADAKEKKLLKNRMDWVLVDAPCTGTGTLRRNPDSKWKLDISQLDALLAKQASIVEEALLYLKPSGTLVYATCSVLEEENERQIDYFQKKFSLALQAPLLRTFPGQDDMDGFFAAVLKRK